MKWYNTGHKGVRYRKHPARKHGVYYDRYFAIRYQMDGVRKEEGLGWESEGITEAKAWSKLEEYIANAKRGQGPTRKQEEDQIIKEKKEAIQREREQIENDQITFKQYAEDYYLPQAEIEKKHHTLRREKSILKSWIYPVIGELPLNEVGADHLEKIKKDMHSAIPPQAPRSIQYMIAVCRQVFNHARRGNKFDGAVPTRDIKKPKFDNRRTRYLSPSEAKNLLAALKKKSELTHDVALMSLHCGLRFGEIVNIRWGDVDLDRGIIMIRKAKNTRTRPAFMTEAVKNLLTNKVRGRSDELVFQGRGGVKIDRVSRTYDRTVQELKLNEDISDPLHKVCFHTLRHSYASTMVEGGVNLYVVKELLGHSSISQTERYSHLGENALQSAVAVLEKSLRAKKHSKKSVDAEGRKSA